MAGEDFSGLEINYGQNTFCPPHHVIDIRSELSDNKRVNVTVKERDSYEIRTIRDKGGNDSCRHPIMKRKKVRLQNVC